jgi:hypothetical protein
MNQLDPSLKRLLKWSRSASAASVSAPTPEEAPFGFAGRVVASAWVTRAQPATTLVQELQRTAWGIACVSLALLLCGALVLLSQGGPPAPEADISSALNFVANNFLH